MNAHIDFYLNMNFFKLSVTCEKPKYYHMKMFCKGVQGIVNAYKKQIRYKGRRKKNIVIRYNLVIPTLYCVFMIYANENAGNLISVVQFLTNIYIYK